MLLRPALTSFKSTVLIFHETKAYATPKRRVNSRARWRKMYGVEQYGSRLLNPKRNITTCHECGNFHEFHTICRHCFNQLQASSEQIMEKIRQPNPLWFDANLSQTAANPGRQITGGPLETVVEEVKVDESKDKDR